jgi:hypothetical protein
MGKGSSSPPPPDPLIGQAAAQNVELGKQSLDFAKQQYADGQQRQDNYDNLIGKVVDSQLSTQDKSNAWAQQDRDKGQLAQGQFDDLSNAAMGNGQRFGDWLGGVAQQFGKDAQGQYANADAAQARYNGTFVPVENKVASDAMNWDSADRQAQMAAQAKSDAMAAGLQAKDASARQMASMGVDPNSGRFAATNRANDTAVALAGAAAQNGARDNVRAQGLALRQQAAQLGQQVQANANTSASLGMQATQAQQNATQAANGAVTNGLTQAGQFKSAGLGAAGIGYQGLGTGITAGNSAVGNQGAGQATFNAGNAAMMNGFGTAGNLTASGGNMADALYSNQLNAWGQQNQAKGAMWQGIGTAAAAAAAAY